MKRLLSLLICVGCGGNSGPAPTPDGPIGDPPPPGPSGEKVFAHNTLHKISIVVEAQHLDQLENDLENRVPCTLTFDGTEVANVGIRKKGGLGSSASLDGKTGFSIKINEFVAGQRLDGLKKFVLNNAKEDSTFLSETVGYASYRELGLVAPLNSHAQVTFNSVDKGIFIVKETIASDFLERAFGKDNDQGNVYEGYYHEADQPLGDFVTHPEEVELKDEVSENRSRADLNALAQIIRDAPDATFVTMVGTKLDLDAYIKGLSIDTIVGYWDSYAFFLNNYYLYHVPATDRFVYIPHGMDQLQYSDPGAPLGKLPERINQIPALRNQLTSQIAAFRAAWPAAALVARIDEVKAVLATATPGPQTDQDLSNFDSSFDNVRSTVGALGN